MEYTIFIERLARWEITYTATRPDFSYLHVTPNHWQGCLIGLIENSPKFMCHVRQACFVKCRVVSWEFDSKSRAILIANNQISEKNLLLRLDNGGHTTRCTLHAWHGRRSPCSCPCHWCDSHAVIVVVDLGKLSVHSVTKRTSSLTRQPFEHLIYSKFQLLWATCPRPKERVAIYPVIIIAVTDHILLP